MHPPLLNFPVLAAEGGRVRALCMPPAAPPSPLPNSAPITGRFGLANLNWLRVVTAAVYHVKEDGWEKISANDSGMEMHYKYAEEGFGVKY
eukprot:COSAG05_NODE_8_length_40675_cov_148.837539_19_plen_91_part_00